MISKIQSHINKKLSEVLVHMHLYKDEGQVCQVLKHESYHHGAEQELLWKTFILRKNRGYTTAIYLQFRW